MARASCCLLLISGLVFAVACKKTSRLPPAPVLAESFRLAETHFREGEFEKAAQSYEAYLRDYPAAPNRERAIFHLALIHILADSSVHDPRKARELLESLAETTPHSLYGSQAGLILGLRKKSEDLQSQVTRLQVEAAELASGVPLFQAEIETDKSNILALEKEIERLRVDVAEREKRIQQVERELDKLKQIDLQRRPSRRPRR